MRTIDDRMAAQATPDGRRPINPVSLAAFVGAGLVGVACMFAGLAWDIVARARDPELAAYESLFTLAKPGNALLGLGATLAASGLAGSTATFAAARLGRGRRMLPAAAVAVALVMAATLGAAGARVDRQAPADETPGDRVHTPGAHDPASGTAGRDEPGLVTETFRLGPYTLSANGEAEGIAPAAPRPAGQIGIRSMTVDVVTADGAAVDHDDVHLHHVVFVNMGRPDSVCPQLPERFGGAGQERTPARLPAGYVYPATATDHWAAVYHLMNMSDTDMEVFISYDVSWLPEEHLGEAREVTPYFLDVTGCASGSEYDIAAAGGEHIKTWTWTPPRDGLMVLAAGHVHDGGLDVVLRRQADGEPLCVSEAGGGGHGHLTMSACTSPARVQSAEVYELVSRYDASERRTGAMGIILAFVAHR